MRCALHSPGFLYPAEKKVSKENGGHGMEHFLREVFCGVNYQRFREQQSAVL